MTTTRDLCKDQLPYPVWLVIRKIPRLWTRGFRQLQFLSLLLTRSYRGLIPALNWWDVIDEHFYLGGALMFDDVERLQRHGVGAVMNLCAERKDDPERLAQARMNYLWLPVIDTCAPTFEQIEIGVAWIEYQLLGGRVIYIHCAAGVGRSATLLACWYLYAQNMSVAQALHLLKKRHPQVSLTRRQIHRLHAYVARLSQSAPRASVTWAGPTAKAAVSLDA